MIIKVFKKAQSAVVNFFTPRCALCKTKSKDLVFWEETGDPLCENCTQKKLSEKRTSSSSH